MRSRHRSQTFISERLSSHCVGILKGSCFWNFYQGIRESIRMRTTDSRTVSARSSSTNIQSSLIVKKSCMPSRLHTSSTTRQKLIERGQNVLLHQHSSKPLLDITFNLDQTDSDVIEDYESHQKMAKYYISS